MRTRTIALTCSLLLLVAGALAAHDMFLKLSSYFLEPNSEATVALINGTFEQSENVVTPDRIIDARIVDGQGAASHPDPSQWRDDGRQALLDFTTGEAGTYVLGVSTAPRELELAAADFSAYLIHDGLLDVYAARRDGGAHGEGARERYSKHVKAIVQVGEERSDAHDRRLGYPVEIVPLQNPYSLEVGDDLDVLVLRDGEPVSNQIVYANYEGYHVEDEAGNRREAVQTRTNRQGVARVPIVHEGRWYLRLIHMERAGEPDLDYESNWATLTFEVR